MDIVGLFCEELKTHSGVAPVSKMLCKLDMTEKQNPYWCKMWDVTVKTMDDIFFFF